MMHRLPRAVDLSCQRLHGMHATDNLRLMSSSTCQGTSMSARSTPSLHNFSASHRPHHIPPPSPVPTLYTATGSTSLLATPPPSCSGRTHATASSSGRGSTTRLGAAVTDAPSLFSATEEPPLLYLGDQRIHSLSNHGLNVINSMQGWAQTDLNKFLRPVERCWQPTDFLPDSSSPDFLDAVQVMRQVRSSLELTYTLGGVLWVFACRRLRAAD